MKLPPLLPVAGVRFSPKFELALAALIVERIFHTPGLQRLTFPPGPAGFFIAGLLLTVGLWMRLVELTAATASLFPHEFVPPHERNAAIDFIPEASYPTCSQDSQKRKKEAKKEKNTTTATAVHLSCSLFHLSRLQNTMC